MVVFLVLFGPHIFFAENNGALFYGKNSVKFVENQLIL
jgi:hypothetical protein